MLFFIVDAFSESLFGGNPAGVVLLDENVEFPDDNVMRMTAAELRYSETAFIVPASREGFKMRYFTPAEEVDFCGHATVAAFTALLKAGLVDDNSEYSVQTLSGDLSVGLSGGFVMMEMPAPKLIKRFEEQEEIGALYRVMGLDRETAAVNRDGMLPALITTGFPDIFLPVKDLESLAAIAPDFDALAALSKEHGAGGVHAFTLDTPESGITACARNFAPLFGIDEEAATGTASGGLAFYLYSHGIVKGGGTCCFKQGEAMGRPSKIVASVEDHCGTVQIRVGGNGVILVEGNINL